MIDYDSKASDRILVPLFDELELKQVSSFENIARCWTRDFCKRMIREGNYTVRQIGVMAMAYYEGYLKCLHTLDKFHTLITNDDKAFSRMCTQMQIPPPVGGVTLKV